MEKFELAEKLIVERKDRFGTIKVTNIAVASTMMDDAIKELVLEWSNLSYLFGKSRLFLSNNSKVSILNRFLPPSKPDDIDQFVKDSLNANHSFYSFLAESILALIFRDVFSYNLSACVLRVTDTIVDSHTGVDGCYYDKANQKIVLGEAKFYKSASSAVAEIKNNFTIDSKTLNQLDSLLRTASANRTSKNIVIKSTGVDDIQELTIEDFVKMELIFGGFVLHEDKRVLTTSDLKNMCDFTSNDIVSHVSSLGPSFYPSANYSLILVHLPILSKEELISSIIKEAYKRKSEL